MRKQNNDLQNTKSIICLIHNYSLLSHPFIKHTEDKLKEILFRVNTKCNDVKDVQTRKGSTRDCGDCGSQEISPVEQGKDSECQNRAQLSPERCGGSRG